LKVAASQYNFKANKKTGIYFSELLPHINKVSDEICLIKSMSTNEINHDPAISALITGVPQPGKPSLGAWVNYGLASLNQNLPSFVVMTSKGTNSNQSINSRLWGNSYLPAIHQGTRFFNSKEPVLFLKNPKNINTQERQKQIKLIKALNDLKYQQTKDQDILARSKNYELALKMQSSIPNIADFTNEKEHIFNLYGPDSRKPGTFAYNCLMARRLAENNVRFIQLFHRGWDQHEYLHRGITSMSRSFDQPLSALIVDLKNRGLLDDTLIVSTTEFGRTAYSQGNLDYSYGRDHHGRCFSTLLAGAGIKKGFSHGETDDFSYNVKNGKVSPKELNATILNLLGIDHKKFSYFHKGLGEKLTGVDPVEVIKEILT
jgi:hypothetical protein